MQASPKPYRVLGIDPGLRVTGYAVVSFARGEPQIVEAGAVESDQKLPMPERIGQIHAALAEIIAELKPDFAAVENLYAHYKHPRTSILMGHARGVLLLACSQAGLAVHNLAATRIKKAITGNGHASKLQIQRSVKTLFNLAELPKPPDVADALAIAICAGRNARLR